MEKRLFTQGPSGQVSDGKHPMTEARNAAGWLNDLTPVPKGKICILLPGEPVGGKHKYRTKVGLGNLRWSSLPWSEFDASSQLEAFSGTLSGFLPEGGVFGQVLTTKGNYSFWNYERSIVEYSGDRTLSMEDFSMGNYIRETSSIGSIISVPAGLGVREGMVSRGFQGDHGPIVFRWTSPVHVVSYLGWNKTAGKGAWWELICTGVDRYDLKGLLIAEWSPSAGPCSAVTVLSAINGNVFTMTPSINMAEGVSMTMNINGSSLVKATGGGSESCTPLDVTITLGGAVMGTVTFADASMDNTLTMNT